MQYVIPYYDLSFYEKKPNRNVTFIAMYVAYMTLHVPFHFLGLHKGMLVHQQSSGEQLL